MPDRTPLQRLHHSVLFALTFLLLCLVLPTHVRPQTILLPERWSFKTGDDSSFALPGTKETGWGMMDVPDWWEREGYDGYDGIAWYRVHFDVPDRYIGKPMVLLLGRIDDADETYINGVRVGGMGEFPPHAVTAYSLQRRYPIPPGLLKRQNVLAVRVNDMMGPGGIVAGPIGISSPEDYRRDYESPTLTHRTWFRLSTTNGLVAAVFDERRGYVESVRPHIFQAFDSARYVRPFVLRVKPIVPGGLTGASYLRNTHVIQCQGEGLTVALFCPFTTGEKIFCAAITGPASKVRRTTLSWEKTETALIVDSTIVSMPNGLSRKYVLFGYVDSLQTDRTVVERALRAIVGRKGRLVEDEVEWMRSIISAAHIPDGISPAERSVLEQSIAVLKMAQVSDREVPAGGRGEILASLPPGDWNIAWVRDGMYAVRALNRLGMFAEAKKYLAFMLDAPSGGYVHYVFTDKKDYGVGVPYQISVCRYFGNGKEESDFNDDGPNIELDGFGMFLSAFSDYVHAERGFALFQKQIRGGRIEGGRCDRSRNHAGWSDPDRFRAMGETSPGENVRLRIHHGCGRLARFWKFVFALRRDCGEPVPAVITGPCRRHPTNICRRWPPDQRQHGVERP